MRGGPMRSNGQKKTGGCRNDQAEKRVRKAEVNPDTEEGPRW